MLIATTATMEMIVFMNPKWAESYLQPESSLFRIVAMLVL